MVGAILVPISSSPGAKKAARACSKSSNAYETPATGPRAMGHAAPSPLALARARGRRAGSEAPAGPQSLHGVPPSPPRPRRCGRCRPALCPERVTLIASARRRAAHTGFEGRKTSRQQQFSARASARRHSEMHVSSKRWGQFECDREVNGF